MRNKSFDIRILKNLRLVLPGTISPFDCREFIGFGLFLLISVFTVLFTGYAEASFTVNEKTKDEV